MTLNDQAASSLAVAGTVGGRRTCFVAQFVPLDPSVAASPKIFPSVRGGAVAVRYERKGRPVARAFNVPVTAGSADAAGLKEHVRQLGCDPLNVIATPG